MSEDVHRELGAHDEAIVTLKGEVHEIRQSLGRIERTLSETKGGLRMLLAVGSLGGAIGAGLVKGYAMLKGGG